MPLPKLPQVVWLLQAVLMQLPSQQMALVPHGEALVQAVQTWLLQMGVGLAQVPLCRVPPQPSGICPQVLPCATRVVGVQVEQQAVPLAHLESLVEPSGIEVLQKMALARLVVLAKMAPVKSASIRRAPLRLALVTFAPSRFAPFRLARERLQPVQSRLGGAV